MCGHLGKCNYWHLQVYKGRLRSNGKAVAVKVQRPGVREQIALDIYILRAAAAALRAWRKLNRWATDHVLLASQPAAQDSGAIGRASQGIAG